MKNLFVQFKSGRTLVAEDICDYVESQDYDVVVSRSDAISDGKESHITIFHDAVEYMRVTDDDWDSLEMKNVTLKENNYESKRLDKTAYRI